MVWYSHLVQNFSQFIVIHTVKGFGIVTKAEIDVFLELSFFFDIQLVVISCADDSGCQCRVTDVASWSRVRQRGHFYPCEETQLQGGGGAGGQWCPRPQPYCQQVLSNS